MIVQKLLAFQVVNIEEVNTEIKKQNLEGWTVKQISTNILSGENGWCTNIVLLFEKDDPKETANIDW